MSRNSISSSRARDRACPVEPAYRKCPLCGSGQIKLGVERLSFRRRDGKELQVRVRRWACPKCQERFLTRDSRHQLDVALGLVPSAKRSRTG